MFSSSQKTKRKRGVILSSEGWQRLYTAQKKLEKANNQSIPYTLEELNEITGLSPHTLTKVRRQNSPVDKQTLECYFNSFELDLTQADYTKPISHRANIANKTQNGFVGAGTKPAEPVLPEGQVPLNSQFYVHHSDLEGDCDRTVMQPGSLIRIKSPRRRGKSSLMTRILDHAKQQGCHTVFLSLQMADRTTLLDLDKFLQWFSASVGLGMNLPNRMEGYWDKLFGSKISCKIYFEEYLLANSTQPVVLALDDVDRLFDYPELADEFFGLLRSWHEQAKNQPLWQKLRLVVAHSTEVYIPLNVNKSPFNVGMPVELPLFNGEQIEQLARSYSLELSSSEVLDLLNLTSGQPYLIQLGLYSLWQEDITPAELKENANAGKGVYADHLQRLSWALEQDPELATAFERVIQSDAAIDLELFQAFQLESLGLVELKGNQVRSSSQLYTDYFRHRFD